MIPSTSESIAECTTSNFTVSGTRLSFLEMTAVYKTLVLWLEGFLPVWTTDKSPLSNGFLCLCADNVKTDRAVAMGNGIYISWNSYPNMTCGYIVKWCHSSGLEPCTVDWQKFPSNATDVVIKSGKSEITFCESFWLRA